MRAIREPADRVLLLKLEELILVERGVWLRMDELIHVLQINPNLEKTLNNSKATKFILVACRTPLFIRGLIQSR